MSEIIDYWAVEINQSEIVMLLCQVKDQQLEVSDLLTQKNKRTVLGVENFQDLADNQEIVKNLKEAVSKSKSKEKQAIFSINESAVFWKIITLPDVEEAKLDESIGWALQPLLPFPIESVNISYIDIASREVEGKKFIDWYVVAAPKQLIARVTDIFSEAGISLLAIETESMSIARSIWFNQEKVEDFFVINFGNNETKIILVKNGVTFYSQSLSIGLTSILNILRTEKGITDEQIAEILMQNALIAPELQKIITEVCDSVVQTLIAEVSKVLGVYKEKMYEGEISKVFLSGSGADLIYSTGLLQKGVNGEVILAEPFKNVHISGFVSNALSEKTINPRKFTRIVGLGLKSVDR